MNGNAVSARSVVHRTEWDCVVVGSAKRHPRPGQVMDFDWEISAHDARKLRDFREMLSFGGARLAHWPIQEIVFSFSSPQV